VLRRWDGSSGSPAPAHCEIGKEHPEAYAEALRAFLRPDDFGAAAPEGEVSPANNIKPFVRATRRVAATETTE